MTRNIFSQRLSEILCEKNMNQADFVRLTGLSKSAISSYIRGDYIPKAKTMKMIADALNVKVDNLSKKKLDGKILIHKNKSLKQVTVPVFADDSRDRLLTRTTELLSKLTTDQLRYIQTYIMFMLSYENTVRYTSPEHEADNTCCSKEPQ